VLLFILGQTLELESAASRCYQGTFFKMLSFTANARMRATITAQVSNESPKPLLEGVVVDVSVDINISPNLQSINQRRRTRGDEPGTMKPGQSRIFIWSVKQIKAS
jgi:hypothetical protein